MRVFFLKRTRKTIKFFVFLVNSLFFIFYFLNMSVCMSVCFSTVAFVGQCEIFGILRFLVFYCVMVSLIVGFLILNNNAFMYVYRIF